MSKDKNAEANGKDKGKTKVKDKDKDKTKVKAKKNQGKAPEPAAELGASAANDAGSSPEDAELPRTAGVASPLNPFGMPVSELLALLQADPKDPRALAALQASTKTWPKSGNHVKIWSKTFGDSITSQPALSLAAWLGHAPAVQAMQTLGLALVPEDKVLAKDPALKPDPYGLGLPNDEKAMTLFTRCVGFWGPDAIRCASLACAELQWQVQDKCPAELRPLRDAAMAAARAHASAQDGASRQAAQVAAQAAAEACWARYEKHRNPDSAAAQTTWQNLGAPWFAAEAAGNAMPLEDYDGDPPREASSSWGARNTVCLSRAAEAATTWTDHPRAMAAMRAALLAWALA